jgi:hypothetical protein
VLAVACQERPLLDIAALPCGRSQVLLFEAAGVCSGRSSGKQQAWTLTSRIEVSGDRAQGLWAVGLALG